MTILTSAHPHKHTNQTWHVMYYSGRPVLMMQYVQYRIAGKFRGYNIVIFVDVTESFLFLFSRITRPCTCVRTRNASYAVRSVFFEATQRTVIRIIQ